MRDKKQGKMLGTKVRLNFERVQGLIAKNDDGKKLKNVTSKIKTDERKFAAALLGPISVLNFLC